MVIIMVVALALTFTPCDINVTDAANSNMTYFIYNAANASYEGSYTIYANTPLMLPADRQEQSRTVFGGDDRVLDYSKKGVVKLIGTNDYLGTGFIVDDHVIATAAHCVTTSSATAEIVDSILIQTLDSNNNIVSTYVTPVKIHVPYNWMEFLQNPNSTFHTNNEYYHWSYDYALITVEQNLHSYKKCNLSIALDDFYPASNDTNPSDNASVSVTGFPQYINGVLKNNKTTHNLYTGTGVTLPYTNMNYQGENPYGRLMFYDTDISSGNSGSPVYYTETYNSKVYFDVVAICTAQKGYANVGLRINEDMLKFYLSNSHISY